MEIMSISTAGVVHRCPFVQVLFRLGAPPHSGPRARLRRKALHSSPGTVHKPSNTVFLPSDAVRI